MTTSPQISTQISTQISQEIQLVARPVGMPKPSDFRLEAVTLLALDAGQILVRNLFLTVDPYMRGRMNDSKSYTAPFALNATMTGGAVGEVLESNSDSVKVGDFVLHDLGWRTHAIVDPAKAKVVPALDSLPLSVYLGVLGMPGMTAYAGLLRIAEFKAGETVFVSGAAGAVGALVGQIAKLRGAKQVIGSAGSAEKVQHLEQTLGFDTAFNYKDESVAVQLSKAAPDGIDVYFDNVGGEHLEAAIGAMNPLGRLALCGAISQYNNTSAPVGPRNLALAIGKQLTLRGFLVSSHYDLFGEFATEMTAWLEHGKIHFDETVLEGIEQTPDALIGLLEGRNTGKMIIKL